MLKAALILLCCLFPFASWADGPLRSVVLFGNEKTDRKTILGIVSVPSRTYINEQLLREVDDRLTNSGLFKSVRVSKVDNRDGTTDLRVNVTEKQLWFAFPIFQAWSGRYNGGLVFGESNLFAPGGRTLFLAQGGNSLMRVFAAFDAKNIFDTNFSSRSWVLGRIDDVPIYEPGTDNKIDEITLKDAVIAVIPGYQWTNAIRTSVRLQYRYVDYGEVDPLLVPLTGVSGDDVSVQFEFLHDSLKRREAFLDGNLLNVTYEFADTRFGTDFTYQMQSIEGVQAFRAFKYFNYVLSARGAIGNDLPFHRELTLGGSSLRGYADRQLRGDTQISAKQDMLFRVYRHNRFSVFGLIFYDVGLLYRDADTIGRSALRNGTGGGLRVSLTDILAPVFGVDFSYGIEDEKFRMYVAVGLVEF